MSMTVHSPLALHGQSQHAQHPQPIRTSVELTSDETQHHHHHQVQNSEGGMGKGDAAYYALDLDDMSPHAPHAHSSGKKRWHVRENVWVRLSVECNERACTYQQSGSDSTMKRSDTNPCDILPRPRRLD